MAKSQSYDFEMKEAGQTTQCSISALKEKNG
jgi:hypothetical protein